MTAATTSSSQLDEFAARAGALYSLPAVAVEVLALTDNPNVDVRALKECIQQDPALTVKLLRVVNSSLFGLSREVGDLNQALALLGVKPLKLLVLGFSLPEDLLAAASRDQLAWYWRHTLARAVAAREIAEQVAHQSGDEAFLAGLLQDIGVLVLLGQLGQPYAAFLRDAIAEKACVHHVQVDALGFDHTELSARLLDDWNMPESLVRAIAEPRRTRRLATLAGPHAATARTLHMAELTAQVVADRRFAALADLLETGRAYYGMDRAQIDELIGSLEPKVAQLADVLSLNLPGEQSYGDILAEAHRQLVALAETTAVEMAATDRAPGGANHVALPPQTTQALGDAVEQYLARHEAAARAIHDDAPTTAEPHSVGRARSCSTRDGVNLLFDAEQLVTRITLAVGACRAERQALSMLAIAVDAHDGLSDEEQQLVHSTVKRVWRSLEMGHPLPEDPQALATMIKSLPIFHTGLCPIDEAISTAGGVAWDAVDHGLMLTAKPGVFVAGEMLDWEAPTGGYLITGCLATGAWAGRHAAEFANA